MILGIYITTLKKPFPGIFSLASVNHTASESERSIWGIKLPIQRIKSIPKDSCNKLIVDIVRPFDPSALSPRLLRELVKYLKSSTVLKKDSLEVIKSYPISGSITVTLEGNDESIDQRPKLKKEINKKKRQYENIAIFSIADRFDSSLGS